MSLRVGEYTFVAQLPKPDHQFAWLKVAEPQLSSFFHLPAQIVQFVEFLTSLASFP